MQATELPFARVNNVAELDRAVQAASASGRAVMLDFYADWCTSCKEMERYTFSNRQVHDELAQLTLLRADVTANNADDQALLKRFGIFGPPTIAFYGKDGQERSNYRVVGYMKAAEFAQVVSRATSAGG
jgi:thiol:disulfide interchange protein DsbD